MLDKKFISCYIKHIMTIQALLRELINKRELTIYKVAKAIGVDHGNLYRSLSDGSNLELNTMLKVLEYLGYEIRFVKSRRKEVEQTNTPKGGKKSKEKGGD
ncbi:MAG: helix-turn-helix domain-containing protein [Pseudomonadota bacterium]